MRRTPSLACLAVAASALVAAPASPAAAAPGVTAHLVVTADDEAGAGEVLAACAGHADPAAEPEWTRVACWTEHAAAEMSAPGGAAATTLSATEPLPVTVCVLAEAAYPGGVRVTDGPHCEEHGGALARPGDGCRAFATAPTADHAFGAWARGGFVCGTARPGLSVEVCLEVLGENGWEPVACDSAGAGTAAYVSAAAYGCRYGLWLVRSAAVGSAASGESDRAESAPAAYPCTPLA